MTTYHQPYNPSPRNNALVRATDSRLVLSNFNLDYDALDKRLNKVKHEFGLRKAVSSRSLTGETRTFAEILDTEVEKIVLFYLRQQGVLANCAWELRETQINDLQHQFLSLDGIEVYCNKYRDLGREVLNLLHFLEENMLRLRNIIEKHDSLFDQRMSSYYFDTRLGNSSKNCQLLQLYHQEGIRAIMTSLHRGFEDLYDARDSIIGTASPLGLNNQHPSVSSNGLISGDGSGPIGSHQREIPRISYQNRFASFSGHHRDSHGDLSIMNSRSGNRIDNKYRNKSTGSLFALLQRTPSSISSDIHGLRDTTGRIDTQPKSLFELEPVLKEITETANRVMHTQKQSTVEFLASTSKMALEVSMLPSPESDADLTAEKRQKKDAAARRGLNINLLLTFIYLANQYVVAPTSGQYAGILGLTPAMSGLIIGLTPTAALVSSVLMSMWSNYSFKKPLISCICCGIVGNILYGMAMQCSAPWMLLAGRLLTGFGGSRVITRRYISDHVPAEDRLLASSKFVTAGAMGLAWGPLISSLVSLSGVKFDWMILSDSMVLLKYNAMTAPGWIMSVLWLASLLLVVLLFEEPDQKYMRATQMKEAKLKKSKSLPAKIGLLSNYKKHDSECSISGLGAHNKAPFSAPSQSELDKSVPRQHKYGFASIMSYLSGNGGAFKDHDTSGSGGGIPHTDSTADAASAVSGAHGLRNTRGSYEALPTEEIVGVETGYELFAPTMLDAIQEKVGSESSQNTSNNPTPLHSRNPSGASLFNDDNSSITSPTAIITPRNHSTSAAASPSFGVGVTVRSGSSKHTGPHSSEFSATTRANAVTSTEQLHAASTISNEFGTLQAPNEAHPHRASTASDTGGIPYTPPIAIPPSSSSSPSLSNLPTQVSNSGITSVADGLGVRVGVAAPDRHSGITSVADGLGVRVGVAAPDRPLPPRVPLLQHQHPHQPGVTQTSYGTQDDTATRTTSIWPRVVKDMGRKDGHRSELLLLEQEQPEQDPSCTQYITIEVQLILVLYIFNKWGQELTVSSIPLLTKAAFGWTEEGAGYYMAVVGGLVLPTNILVNFFVKDLDERDMVLRLLYVSLASALFVCHTDLLGPYSLLQYIAGTAVFFAALNSMEGITMALLAKLISPELAKGTFNSGLLATEAGTFGRVLGDMSITLFGTSDDAVTLVNRLFLPLSFMMLAATLFVHWFYARLY